MTLSSKISSKLKARRFYFYLLILIVFVPKLNLISIPGAAQGIRIDDLLLLIFGLHYFFVSQGPVAADKLSFCFIYICLVSLINSLYMQSLFNLFVFFRLLEFWVLWHLVKVVNAAPKFNLEWGLFLYLVVNCVTAFAQHQGLIGAFGGSGILAAGDAKLVRPYGLTGGPWDLATVSFLTFVILRENRRLPKLITTASFLLATGAVFIAGHRIIWVAYSASITLLIARELSYRGRIISVLMLPMVCVAAVTLSPGFLLSGVDVPNAFDSFSTDISSRVTGSLYLIVEIFRGSTGLSEVLSIDPSWLARVAQWELVFNDAYMGNVFGMFFGHGVGEYIYIESSLLRLVFGFGVFGFLVIALLSYRAVPAYAFSFVFITASLLDIFISFKIFVFLCFFFSLSGAEKR